MASIVTTCDRPKACAEALASVSEQSRRPDRVIVVDDGAVPMETVPTGIEYVRTAGRVGGAAARNFGAECARGCDILMFLDDDDTWEPEKVSRQLEAFDRNPAVVLVYTGRLVVDPDERGKVLYRVRACRSGELARELLIDNIVGVTSGVAVRAYAFWEAGGFDPEQPARQDYDLWIRISMIGPIVADGGYNLRYTLAPPHAKNVSRGNFDKHRFANDRLRKKYRDQLASLPLAARGRAFANQEFYLTKLLRTRSWRRGMASAIRAFLCFPNPKYLLVVLPTGFLTWLRKRTL